MRVLHQGEWNIIDLMFHYSRFEPIGYDFGYDGYDAGVSVPENGYDARLICVPPLRRTLPKAGLWQGSPRHAHAARRARDGLLGVSMPIRNETRSESNSAGFGGNS